LVVLWATACIRPADERARFDTEVGRSEGGGLEVAVVDGQAQILELTMGTLVMWAQAPTFSVEVMSSEAAPSSYRVEVLNCLVDTVLIVRPTGAAPRTPERRDNGSEPTRCVWDVSGAESGAMEQLDFFTPDSNAPGRWSFAVMGDIQTALGTVDDVFARMNQDPELRFVVSTGDLVENGSAGEYDLLEQQYKVLVIPFYSTIGNHELESNFLRWHNRFGRFNVHFEFRNVVFSFVDSGNATLDPNTYEQLDQWLAAAAEKVHIFGTHYPPLDPIGVRNGGFRSRKEAAKLLTRLARGNVDLTVYGHIHSFYAFENAGIPAYISGGGGARPEKWDGIGRHYLKVTVDSDSHVDSVAIVRVD